MFFDAREEWVITESSVLTTGKFQLNLGDCLPFSIYWPIDLIREVSVYLTLSQLASFFSSDQLIWNGAFCYPYFSVLPPCKGKIHSGNIKSKEERKQKESE